MERAGQLLGNYRLARLIGQGSFADVYLAEHRYLGTQVAVKILLIHLTDSEREDFRAEAHTIARLEHPHIVEILDFGVEENIPYLVMDYAPNGTLRQRHPRGTPLSLPPIILYAKQVADALQYIHSQKLIHRDVKPENLLIGSNEEILLSDFGTALLIQSSRSLPLQQTAGTISYMAPEQIQGQPCFASDQYALGIVVYEWLCGECPFKGSFTEIATQHLLTAPPSLREKVSTVPPAVEEVVLTALVKNPQQRFANVQAFVNALEQASQVQQAYDPFLFSGSQPTVSPSSKSPPRLSHLTTSPTQAGGRPAARQRHLPKGYLILALLLIIALLVAGGSYTYLAVVHSSMVAATATAQAAAAASVKSAIDAYNAQVATHGTMFGFDAQHSHYNPYEHILNPANVSQLQQKWASVTGTGLASTSPAVVGGIVYVGSNDGKLYAFDAATGQQKWVAPTTGALESSPAVANGVVYVGSWDHKLYAFDAATGQQKWAAPTGLMIDTSPVVIDGVVYIGSLDHKLYAFYAATGRQKWAAQPGSGIESFSPAAAGGAIESSPAVVDGVVYVGCDDGQLYAFDAATGRQKWIAYIGGEGVYSSPAVVNGVVYIGSLDHNLYAFDAATGHPKWVAPTGNAILSSPAVANGVVYIGSLDHKLYAFDAVSGQKKWAAQTGDVISLSSPMVANGVVYIGSLDHNLYAFDAATGQKKWMAPTADLVVSSPTVANGVVYIGSDKLYAFSPI